MIMVTCTRPAISSTSKCDYKAERRMLYYQISTLIGVVCADVCSVYGTSMASGDFDHYWGELVKVAGWLVPELQEHAGEWRDRPLGIGHYYDPASEAV